MKISAEAKARNRQAILDAAALQIRTKGPSGVSVAEVMAGAGLTHGGFYNHFGSREDLIAAALDQAVSDALQRLSDVTRTKGFDRFMAGYLSEGHLDKVAGGCPFAATATEMARQPDKVRLVFAEGLREFLATDCEGQERRDVVNRISGAVGALILARAVAQDDRELALELLSSANSKD